MGATLSPFDYGKYAAALNLTSPLRSALRGSQIGGLIGVPVGAYRYLKAEDPKASDLYKPVLTGAALGGLAGGATQHLMNNGLNKKLDDQMSGWDVMRGNEIFSNAIRDAKMNGSATPVTDATSIFQPARNAHKKRIAETLTERYGDNNVFSLKTHRGY